MRISRKLRVDFLSWVGFRFRGKFLWAEVLFRREFLLQFEVVLRCEILARGDFFARDFLVIGGQFSAFRLDRGHEGRPALPSPKQRVSELGFEVRLEGVSKPRDVVFLSETQSRARQSENDNRNRALDATQLPERSVGGAGNS